MHLKIETLSLNDSNAALSKDDILPKEQQIRDDVLLLWREEPDTEELEVTELHQRIMERNPKWRFTFKEFEKVLTMYNLYSTDDKLLKGYSDQLELPNLEASASALNIPEDLEILTCPDGKGRGLFTKVDIAQGELILNQQQPLVTVPPIEKLSLMEAGKVCSSCGSSITNSPHFIIMNGLDCNTCGAVWCCSSCKKRDVTHDLLKHIRSKNKLINPSGWERFEKYCKDNVFVAAYSIGIIYASIIAERNTKFHDDSVLQQFLPLCQISQRIRKNVSDSTNLGGKFDASSGAVTAEDPEPVWRKAYELFKKSFPSSTEIDFEMFLTYIGKFNINQANGQIYPLYSFINHDCEPNVRYEIDERLALKLYARKPIKAGTEILTTYVNPLHGSKLRRRELRVNWGFLCYCDRCKRELQLRQSNCKNRLIPSHKTFATEKRRKSSLRNARPDLHELLKNGKEFDLDVPDNPQIGSRRRTSVRFDNKVIVAVEE